MDSWIRLVSDWSEGWALLIPISILLWRRKWPSTLSPIVMYVLVALILNFAQDYIWKARITFSFSSKPGDNNFIYNLHSIARLLLFSWFFIKMNHPGLLFIKKIIPVLFVLFVLANFTWNEKFKNFSSITIGLESGLELFYCLLYYLRVMHEDHPFTVKTPEFWVVTGISMYVVVNFPIFLFYEAVSKKFEDFAIDIWILHNILYVILCCFIARAFYEDLKKPSNENLVPARRVKNNYSTKNV